jgi:hypothetical protein
VDVDLHIERLSSREVKKRFDDEDTGVVGEPSPVRPDRPNEITRIVNLNPEPQASFEATFRAIFPKLKPLHDAFSNDGVLCVAARGKGPIEAYVHLAIDSTEGTFGTIGRHDRCSLILREDGISLRHALVRASRTRANELRIRLIDLASGGAFRTEDDLPCKSVAAEGPLFVRAAGYQIYCFPTGSLAASPWSADARNTWASFPERVYLDRRVPDRMAQPRRPVAITDEVSVMPMSRSTITTLLPAAQQLRARPGVGGIAVGTIRLTAAGSQLAHKVYADDLERGVLIGRYERCQLAGDDRSLSRVHLIVLRDEDGVWAVDTASRNGTHLEGRPVAAVQLDHELELTLANAMALRWVPDRHAQA